MHEIEKAADAVEHELADLLDEFAMSARIWTTAADHKDAPTFSRGDCRVWAERFTKANDTIRSLIALATAQAALIAERDAARDAALEEAAKVAESPDLPVFKRGWSTSQDAAAISTMMAVAAAIRALKGKSHE